MSVIKQFVAISLDTLKVDMVSYLTKHMCNSNATKCKYFVISCPCKFLMQMPMDEWNTNMAFHSSINE
jgi:hypothetical protein